MMTHSPVLRTLRKAVLSATAMLGLSAAIAQANPNWMPYSDSLASALKLTPEQRKSFADMDKRYQTQYSTLGNDALQQNQYPTLDRHRQEEIQHLLQPAQYQQWQEQQKHYVPGTVAPLPNNGGQNGVDQQGPPTLPPTPAQPEPTPTPGSTK